MRFEQGKVVNGAHGRKNVPNFSDNQNRNTNLIPKCSNMLKRYYQIYLNKYEYLVLKRWLIIRLYYLLNVTKFYNFVL